MDIRIGMINSGRELTFSSDETADAIAKKVDNALSSDGASLSLTDSKGATYIVPTAALAYVEIGTEEARRVGFVA